MTFPQDFSSNPSSSVDGTYRQIDTSTGAIVDPTAGGLGDQSSPISTSVLDSTPVTAGQNGAPDTWNYTSPSGGDPGVTFNGMTFGYDLSSGLSFATSAA